MLNQNLCKYLLLTITTGNRRRQKLLAEILTALFKSHFVGINPSTYNFSKRSELISVRNGSFASISLTRFANSRMVRDNLLYLCELKFENKNETNKQILLLCYYSLCIVFTFTKVKFSHHFGLV